MHCGILANNEQELLRMFDARYHLPSRSYFSRTDQMILKVRHLNSRYVSIPRYLLKKYRGTILYSIPSTPAAS